MWIVIRYPLSLFLAAAPPTVHLAACRKPRLTCLCDAVLVAEGMEAESFSSAGLIKNSGCAHWMMTICSKTVLLAAFQ